MKLSASPELASFKEAMLKKIDSEAEAFRHFLITPGSGQAMVYQEKNREAEIFVQNPDVDPELVGDILNEVGITAPTAWEVAQIILNLRALWKYASRPIERKRLEAKEAVRQATSVPEARQAAEINWMALLPT